MREIPHKSGKPPLLVFAASGLLWLALLILVLTAASRGSALMGHLAQNEHPARQAVAQSLSAARSLLTPQHNP